MAMQEAENWVPEWHFGDRVRKARREPRYGRAMGQQEFADAVGISVHQLTNWEAGVAKQPRDILNISRRISAVTGYPLFWIMAGESEPVSPPPRPVEEEDVGPAGIEPATTGLPDPHILAA